MRLKRGLICLLSCLMLVSMAMPVSAAETSRSSGRTYYSEEYNTEVIIEAPASNMPQDYIEQIAKENPNTQVIISNFVDAAPAIQPRLVMGVQITEKKITKSSYVIKDAFVISVAKGSKVTLSQTWSESVSASVTHAEARTALKLNGTITKTYTKTQSFTGPPESSSYNSREYRVKFYVEDGTYKGYYITDMGRGPSISGSFRNPLKYAEYSINKRI